MAPPLGRCGVVGDDGAYGLAGDDPPDVAPPSHVEDHDGQLVFHAERDGRGVHDREAPVEGLDVTDARQLDGLRVLRRVGGVDTVYLGGLQKRLRADLDRPQGTCGVRREERVASARGEDHHASLLEVPDGAPPDVRLGNFADLERAQHARRHVDLLERVLDRQRVQHRSEHSHVVAGGTFDAHVGGLESAEDVTAADHQSQLATGRARAADLLGQPGNRFGVDAVILTAGERFPTQLEQNSPVLWLEPGRYRRSVRHSMRPLRRFARSAERLPQRDWTASSRCLRRVDTWQIVAPTRSLPSPSPPVQRVW